MPKITYSVGGPYGRWFPEPVNEYTNGFGSYPIDYYLNNLAAADVLAMLELIEESGGFPSDIQDLQVFAIGKEGSCGYIAIDWNEGGTRHWISFNTWSEGKNSKVSIRNNCCNTDPFKLFANSSLKIEDFCIRG